MRSNIISGRKLLMVMTIVGAGICFSVFFTSCSRNNPDSPGVEYMPDMYRSPSFEDNSVNSFYADGMTDRVPVKGTVPVGFTPDPFPNTPEGWTNASQYLKDPFPASAEVIAEGKAKFEIFCIHCHGPEGQGDGAVAGKLPGPPPPYNGTALKNITEGEMYQTLEYGKGLMGSHASQLTVEERWKIIRYVQVLQHKGEAVSSDTTKTVTAPMPSAQEKKPS
ncbi:MAG TPA: cytochrome c [Bacteroidia bacterium]|nr:cytochrome c [Bacteroidia bacterium]